MSRRRDAGEALGQAQKMEAVGQLTGGIPHDFNNPLQVMSNHLDILRVRLDTGRMDDGAARRSIDNIRSAVGKPATLGDKATGVLQLEPDLDNCQLDPTQLEVTLLNILINARDAMPECGKIAVKTRNVVVRLDDVSAFAGLPPGNHMSLSVADTGTGIPAAIVSRVMAPFFTTKAEEGLGTTVRMYFPVAKTVYRGPTEPTRRAIDRGGKETILVVDDRIEVAELSHDTLKGPGYKVYMAHSGREALQLVQSLDADEKPQLLFSDLIVPGGMNGHALAREIRLKAPSIKILLTTGFAGSSDGKNSDEGAKFEIVKKPYRLADLARRVRMVLDGPTGNLT